MPTTNIPECQSRQSLLNAYFHEEASFWDEIYKGHGVTEIIHQERLRVILTLADKFGRTPSGRWLDVGCGAGLAAVELARRGHAMQALDSVLEMVRLTRTRAAKEGLDSLVKCELGDVQALPFADETFSMVIAAGVLPWLPSIDGAVREMCRVLEPGGRLVLHTSPNVYFMHLVLPSLIPLFALLGRRPLALKLLRQYRASWEYHAREYSEGRLRRLFRRSRFDHVVVQADRDVLRGGRSDYTASLQSNSLVRAVASAAARPPLLWVFGNDLWVVADKRT